MLRKAFLKFITALAFLCHAFVTLLRMRLPVFRHRYVFTPAGVLRARYSCVLALLCVALLGLAVTNLSWPSKPINTVTASLGSIPEGVRDAQEDLTEVVDALLDEMPDVTAPLPKKWSEALTFQSGDTIGKVLNDKDVPMADVQSIIKALSPYIKPQDFKVGQVLDVNFDRSSGAVQLQDLSIRLSDIKTVIVSRGDSDYYADTQEIELHEEQRAARAVVSNSIYADLQKQGVPNSIIAEMIRAYAHHVDFQRDIWGGEEIEMLYTVKASEDGAIVKGDDLKFANLTIRDKSNPIYRHQHKDGRVAFYTADGKSAKKALLRTPVDGARISSSYGMRRHPVLGYNKMHKGVDFAAPRGTPIYAAGDGVIEKQYRSSSYGNYIRIRHTGTYKTAYAHMHRFAKGMKQGKRVRQGQVIGYVGSTGRSTGPHLHYEVHKGGKQVNPRSVNLPIGERLTGTELANFKNNMLRLRKQFARRDPEAPKKLAQNQN